MSADLFHYMEFSDHDERGVKDEKNLPAEEASEEERAWFPQTHGDQKRAQGSRAQKSKRQSASDPLIRKIQDHSWSCGLYF